MKNFQETNEYEFYQNEVPNKSTNPEEDFVFFKNNIKLILNNLDKIIETQKYYYCQIDQITMGTTLTGKGSLTLGDLAILWKNKDFITRCENCDSEVYIFAAGGSLQSGSGSVTGICLDTGEIVSKRSNIGQLYKNVRELMKNNKRNMITYKRYKYKNVGFKSLNETKKEDEIVDNGFPYLTIQEVVEELKIR